MKKSLKKILSLALVLIMALAVAIPAFAAVSKTEAEDIALKAVNVKRSDAAAVIAEADYELGKLYKFEVDIFVAIDNNSYTEYEVDVRVSDGKVIKKTSETTNIKPVVGGTDIGEAKAKHNALAAFNVAEGSVSRLKVERDFDNGTLVYDIDFYVGKDEYSCEVNGYTGLVSDMEIDRNEVNDNFFAKIARFFEMIKAWLQNIFKF